jgi:hypothetical protein
MSSLPAAAFGLVAALALLSGASAAPPAAEAEIAYLLRFVEQSGCEFYRNGDWYDSGRAAAHLRDKYAALAARGEVASAEEFIDRVATRSILSGRPYEVRCDGGGVVAAAQWLREALLRYRTTTAPGAAQSGWQQLPGRPASDAAAAVTGRVANAGRRPPGRVTA